MLLTAETSGVTPPAAWSIRLLDHFALSNASGDVPLTARKAIALLAFLTLQQDRAVRRDTIAGLLWEDVDTAQARVSLRQAIAAIRRVEDGLGSVLLTEPDLIRLNADVVTDVDRFRALAAGSPEDQRSAADLYRTELLAGFTLRDAPAFNEWLAIAQAQWRQRAVDVMQSLADKSLDSDGDVGTGIEAALKLLAIDPFNESGHRALMRLYVRQGRAARALAQYRLLSDLLRRELQVAPDAETQALHEHIRGSRRQRDVPKPAVPPAERLAVPGTLPADVEDEDASSGTVADRATVDTRYIWLAFAAVALICGYLAWQKLDPFRADAPKIARIFPISTTDADERSPALSPDGNTLVFTLARDRNVDLYSLPVEGQGEPVRLTDNPAIDGNPAWRPDGKALAFVRTAPARDRPCEIVVRLMPSGPERPVGRCRVTTSTALAWSKDGQTLYFSDDVAPDKVMRIFALRVSDGAVSGVTDSPPHIHGDQVPAMSADGQRLAFGRRTAPFASDLMMKDLASGRETVLQRGISGLDAVRWSKGDAGLIYSVSRGSDVGLWWSEARSDAPRVRLSTGLLGYAGVSTSAGARRLAVQTSQERRSVVRLPADATNAGGKTPLASFGTGMFDRYPVEARDGRIAFVSSRSGSEQIWVSQHDRPAQPLTEVSGFSFDWLAWSPNGRILAASATIAGRSDIFLVDTSNGRVFRVTNDAAVDGLPVFSANGRDLYWSSFRDNVSATLRIQLGSKGPPVTVSRDNIAFIQPSPDGRYLYYMRWSGSGIMRRAILPDGTMTGSEELVVSGIGTDTVNNWALSGNSLIYPRPVGKDGITMLVRYDLARRTEMAIAGTETAQGRLYVSSSARGSILLSRVSVQNDISGIDFE